MFAPPPVQLSRAEIQTRLEGEAKHAERVESPDKSSDKSSQNAPSLHRNDSRSPISPLMKRFARKGSQPAISPPPIAGPSSPPAEKKRSPREASATLRPDLERLGRLPAGSFSNPRPAPQPPTRPAPIPSDLWRPSLPGAFPLPQEFVSDVSQDRETAPPIPPKSARRPSVANAQAEATKTELRQTKTATPHRNLSARLANLESMPTRTQRVPSVASVANRKYSHPTARQLHSRNSKPTGVRSTRVQKAPISGKSTATTAYHGLFYPEMTNSSHTKPQSAQSAPGNSPRTERESTLKSLQKHAIYEDSQLFSPSGKQDARDRLRFMKKALPDTPTSIIETPTEVYEHMKSSSPTIPRSRSQRSHTRQRSPLSQISVTDAQANSLITPEFGAWPGRLPAIPELTTSEEKISIASGALRGSTQMHLRGGSVVTVCPPESTPWQRTVYIQGPIKLPKPVIVPRRNSLASLEPFQEAIDQMYQDALYIPRRRSDDKVLDDVCDFFDEFGFEDLTFLGDALVGESMDIDDITEVGNELERFSTPPGESTVSPIERTVARDFIETLSSIPSGGVKGGSDGVKGTASLANDAGTPGPSHYPRKDSTTLSTFDIGPSSSLRTPKEATRRGSNVHLQANGNGKPANKPPEDAKIIVKELDASSEWVAPALFKRVWNKQNIIREKSIHKRTAS